MASSKSMKEVLRVFFSVVNRIDERSDENRIKCEVLSWNPFPEYATFGIAEIGISGGKIKAVCEGFGLSEWRIRWILPQSLDERFFPELPGCPGSRFLYPLWLTKEPVLSPMPFDKKAGKKADGQGGDFSFGYDSVPDAEEYRTFPSWWVVASRKWRSFIKTALFEEDDMEGTDSGEKTKKQNASGRPLRLEDFIRLESGLNGLFLEYPGRQECGAQEADSSWNALRLLEEKRRVDVDWWGRQQGRLRRPHLSHERRLCPFQTPESPRIGLQMYLAADATPDAGRISEGRSVFSPATGLIPYPLHTDGPRLLMGGKNMKQAETGIASPEPPLVPGHLEGSIMEELDSFPPDCRTERRFFPFLGRNVWVAVMPFDGFTYEDGLVVSESLAKDFSLNRYEFGEKKLFRGLSLDAVFKKTDPHSLRSMLDRKVKVYLQDSGCTLRFGDPLPLDLFAHFFDKGKEILRGTYLYHLPSQLAGIKTFPAVARNGRVDLELRLVYRTSLPLSFGDKLTGRNGNKGVVTRILQDDERPVARIAGCDVPVDLMISPCSIWGRKNLGQILEMLHALLLKGEEWKTPMGWHAPRDRSMTSGELREKALPELRASFGADEEGLFPLRFPDGRYARAFVAPQYFLRLHHHGVKKLQARGASGPMSPATGLPDRGGARTAQRMGEMEHWSILSYPESRGKDLLLSLREKRGSGEGNERMRSLLRSILTGLGLCLEEKDGAVGLRPLTAECVDAMRKQDIVVEEMDVFRADQEIRKLSPDKAEEMKNTVWRISSVSADAQAPGAVVEKILGERYSLFGKDGALWAPLNLLFLHPELLGQSGRELPKTGLLRLLKDLKSWAKYGGEKEHVEKTLLKYRKSLVFLLAGKEGLVRQSMMGRRFSASGRGVIVPEPDLAPDEVFLPLTQFAGMLPGAPDIRNRLSARCEDRFFFERLREWMEPGALAEAARVLDGILRTEPVWCLMIRQPSLHRHSVQAFRVRIWEKSVIGMPPLATAGFNADFDGDTMAVFLPPEPYAQDLSPFSLLENPGIVGTGAPAFAVGLDLALGWNALSGEEKAVFFEEAGCPFDASMAFKKFFPKLLRALGKRPVDERRASLRTIQKEVCRASTGQGSLGPAVFQRLCDAFRARFQDVVHGLAKCTDEEYDSIISRVNEALKSGMSGAITLLVASGAKGGPDDLRAMGAFLGVQKLFQNDEKNSPDEIARRGFIGSNLWEGLSEEEMFVYSYASRDSMASKKLAVAEAGYLSRLLAEGLFETFVTDEDCGATKGLSIAFDKYSMLSVAFPGSRNFTTLPTMGSVVDDLSRIAWGRVPVGMSRCLKELDLQEIVGYWRGEGDVSDEMLRTHLAERDGVLEIRSPLSCSAASPCVCSLCCGADLARKPFDDPAPLPLGARVGLTAAQAIGERGTQLAMKRFHQVGDPKNTAKNDAARDGEKTTPPGVPAVLRALLVDADTVSGQTQEERFVSLFENVLASGNGEKEKKKAEKDLPQSLIHFEIALRPDKGLYSEAESRIGNAFLSRLAFEGAGEVLKEIENECIDDLASTKSRLLWS